ncbi:MAG: filamentous hemagglutinin N-terminal domain-containing protein [Iphinoe sp. HA4291-MV1]|jgi:filamentous hemagglutinin family protein|nr:filamentous hemagglutinin N-terminal domain-containing protein [Iphinoe sp. HA4291-MV1]
MEASISRFCFLSGSILFWLLVSKPTVAQIVPDNTLPVNSTVTPQGNTRVIEGGSRQGNNLFHSFREFSFSVLTRGTTGDTAFFNNDLAVRNIITRVTGGSRSNIDGTIRANGTANLFFINPNGIIFGRNASLQIGGSFVGSTANSLKFADGKEFSATTPQNSPLLTVSVPIGLQFGANPGEIVKQSQASLQVPSSKTLALVGGNVSLMGGNLRAVGGRIELGSVAGNSLVNLREIPTGYALDYGGVEKFQDIQLSQGAVINISGISGGTVQLQGRNITLTNNSQIISATLGTRTGENLLINATESLKLSGGSNIGTFALGTGRAGDVLVKALDSIELVGTTSIPSGEIISSGLGSQVLESAMGNGGNITLETRRLSITEGARVDASTFGAGRGGNVLVRASDLIELKGAGPNGRNTSGIFTQVAERAIPNAGDAGNITIETKFLTAFGGGQISSATFKGGKSGTVTINASDSIQLSGFAPAATRDNSRSGIFVSAERGSTNDAGELRINTGKLTVENGAEISANNFGPGKGGTATLNVGQLLVRNGGEVRARAFASGPGGNLIVNAADSVEVSGKGSIGSEEFPSALSISAEGSGQAGNLEVTTRSIKLDNGKLIGETTSSDGGNITLNLKDLLLLRRNSQISTSAGITQGSGNGGNIIINAPNGFIVATPGENNDITANAFSGQGGKVTINATGIFGMVPRTREELQQLLGTTELNPNRLTTNDITAISQTNPSLNGVVTINTPDVDLNRGLVQLPAEPVNVQVAQGCQATGTQTARKQSSLAFTGKGGLAVNPYEPLSSSNIWEDVPASTQTGTSKQIKTVATVPDKIVEAQGWVRNEKGEVFLVAEDSRCSLR